MKHLLFLILAAFAPRISAQNDSLPVRDFITLEYRKSDPKMFPRPKYNWKRGLLCFGTGLFSGATRGIHETINYRYDRFKLMHPGANDQYWNPQESWTNKYRNRDPEQGPKFPLSTTALVGFTDAKHLFGQASTAGTFTMGLLVTLGDKKPWHHYALNALSSAVGYGLGFHIIYDRIYGQKPSQ